MIVFNEGVNGLPRVWMRHMDRCVNTVYTWVSIDATKAELNLLLYLPVTVTIEGKLLQQCSRH
jgi:hypothetical protein